MARFLPHAVVARCLAVLVLAGLLRAGLWLLVAGGLGVAAVVLRERWLDRRRWRPVHAAVVAVNLVHPVGNEPSDAVLAVLAQSRQRRTVADRAGDVLRQRTDLQEWASGAREIALAEAAADALDNGTSVKSDVFRVTAWACATTAVLVLEWSPVWVVVPFVGTLIAVTDLRNERQLNPLLLAARSIRASAEPDVDVEPEVRLARLARSRTVLGLAADIVETASLSRGDRDAALAMLTQAAELVPTRELSPRRTAAHHLPEVATAVTAAALMW